MGIFDRWTYRLSLVWCLLNLASVTKGQGPSCTGQVVGEEFPDVAVSSTGSNTGSTYLLRDASMAIPCCGVISSWRYVTQSTGQLTVQVWEPVVGNTYSVLAETDIPGSTVGNINTYTVPTDSQISVEQDQLIGWYSPGADIVGFETNAAYNQGVVSRTGKTAQGSTELWSNTLVNGERWMFGAVLSPNSAPTVDPSLPTTVTATVSDAVGTPLYTLAPSDTNPDDVAGLTVSINPASTLFELSGNDVQIKSTLTVGTHEVVLEVVDHCLTTGTATLTVEVTDEPPEITSLPIAAVLLREDTELKTLLHTLEWTDDVDTALDCYINNTDPTGAPFSIEFQDASTDYGIYFAPSDSSPLDYDVIPLYSLFIACNDSHQASETKEFQISIEPNEPPVPDIPAEIEVIGLDTDNGTVVHTLTATDPEGLDYHFTMDCPGCPFAIRENGEIYATEDLHSHRVSPYVATVNVTDGYNIVGPTDVTITITDINNPPNITNPTKTLPKFDTVYVFEHTDEGTPNLEGTVTSVYTVTGFDEDSDAVTWDIEFYNGQDEQLFDYDNQTGEIFTKKDLDYEYLNDNGLLTTRAYVRAFDGREYSNETRLLMIVVEDVNETPYFNQELYAIETVEGTDGRTVTLDCPMFEVTDEDHYDTRTYDINCGSVGHFSIANNRLPTCDAIIEMANEYDLDSPGQRLDVVTCDITVFDKGGLSNTTVLEIKIHEDDDNAPILDQGSYSYTITNDTNVGALFGNADATDDDFLEEHRRLTYTTDSSEFGVDENGVFVSKVDWTNVNAPTSRTFNLRVEDEAGHFDTAPVTVQIIDIPPTTTVTVAMTTLPSVYRNIGGFFDDAGNLAWLIPAILLGLLALGLMGFLCARCCKAGGCAGLRKGWGSRMSRFGGRMGMGRGGGRGGMMSRGGGRGGGMMRGGVRGGARGGGGMSMRGGRGGGGGMRRIEGVRTAGRMPIVQSAPAPLALPPPNDPPPPTTFRQPSPPVKQPLPVTPPQNEPPKEKKSFFDRFKKKPTEPAPEPEPLPTKPVAKEIAPKQQDERKTFHLWNHNDFQSQQKWVG